MKYLMLLTALSITEILTILPIVISNRKLAAFNLTETDIIVQKEY